MEIAVRVDTSITNGRRKEKYLCTRYEYCAILAVDFNLVSNLKRFLSVAYPQIIGGIMGRLTLGLDSFYSPKGPKN
jgi:hypothetical protein